MLRPCVSLAALLLLGAAAAQSGNPAVVTPGTPERPRGSRRRTPSTLQTGCSCSRRRLAAWPRWRWPSSCVARSREAEVEAFADRMKADHGKANAELKRLADAAGVTLPTTLDAEHQRDARAARDAIRPRFDLAYLAWSADRSPEDRAAAHLRHRLRSGSRAQELRRQNLPIVLEHLQMVQNSRPSWQAELPSIDQYIYPIGQLR